MNAVAYLLICLTGLTGVLMALIPTEAVMVLLVFVGFSVTAATFQELDKKYVNVVLLSLVPIFVPVYPDANQLLCPRRRAPRWKL